MPVTFTLLDTIEAHSSHVTDVAFGIDGATLFSAGFRGELRCWSEGTFVRDFVGLASCVNAVAWDAAERTLYAVSNEEGCRAWDVVTGEGWATGEGRPVIGRPKAFNSVALADDGAALLLANARSTLYRVSKTGAVAYKSDLGGKNRRILATLAHQGLVACGGLGPELPLIDQGTGETATVLNFETAAVTSAALSPDGSTLVVATYEGALYGYDLGRGRLGPKAQTPSDRISSVRFLGERLVAAAPFALLAFDPGDFRLVARAELPTKGNYAIAVAPDGCRAAVGSADGRVRVFALEQRSKA